jgi:hypothetical protein
VAGAAAAGAAHPAAVAHLSALRSALAAPTAGEVEDLGCAGGQRQQHPQRLHLDGGLTDVAGRAAHPQYSRSVECEGELELDRVGGVAQGETRGARVVVDGGHAPRPKGAHDAGARGGDLGAGRARPSGVAISEQ